VFSYRCKLIYIYVCTLKIYDILNIKNTLLISVHAAAQLVKAQSYKRVRFPLGPLEFFIDIILPSTLRPKFRIG
jgi:hypothetical protein